MVAVGVPKLHEVNDSDEDDDFAGEDLKLFASTVPFTRVLIDRLHDIGVCPKLQIVAGGGVFNRADGLAEEIGADLWARTPQELVQTLAEQPERRMTADQRTVGRRRRVKLNAA